jgi:hypothetical protein
MAAGEAGQLSQGRLDDGSNEWWFANPLWRALRIHSELKMPGIVLSERGISATSAPATPHNRVLGATSISRSRDWPSRKCGRPD